MEQRYALVTGGSRGLGRAICLKLASQGFSIIINYKSNVEAAKETLNTILNDNGQAELLQFDVSSEQEIEKAIDSWQEKHKEEYISVLVNNAGIRQDNLMIFMQDKQWKDVLDTTINGFFYTTRYLLKNMISNRFGRIVNIASLSGIKGLPGQTNYSAAKAALIGATKALAQEVAIRKITVNAVAPGFIETDMTKDINQDTMKKMIPIGRFGKPEEVANLVSFLVSEESSYITGEVISINGGLYT
jgi:3-oxoacyl-[acyl-carrier protein] reductase